MWGRGESKILLWENFFTGWREPEEEWFWQFEPFSKLKTAFCECWTSIKTKINMTCVPKEYEIKTKITWKLLFSGRGDWLLMCGGGGWLGIKIWLVVGGRNFSRWEWRGWANFWPVGGGLPHSPGRENPRFTSDFLENFTLELQSVLFCYIIQCKHYIKTRYLHPLLY